MVEKLKERKPSVVEALSNAMDGVFSAVNPSRSTFQFQSMLTTAGRPLRRSRRNARRLQTQKSPSKN